MRPVQTLTRPGSNLWRLAPLLVLYACAAPQVPTGGPKDTTPPRIISETSTPNRQTNFTGRQVTVTFDEWVQLKDVYTQLIVSPPMPAEPEVKLKGKSLVIDLPDSLREATTYTLQFGNAIADLNESNVLENFSFVFSTGPRLDSAGLGGTVIDAVTLKPADAAWVMLYPYGADSAVYTRKPDYISKTNKSGRWSIANIRPDSFLVMALKDANLNYLFDQESEWIGWLDSAVVTTTSTITAPDIMLSPRELPLRISDIQHPGQGWLKLVIPGILNDPAPAFLPPMTDAVSIVERDTLHVFYPHETNFTGNVVLGADTSRVRLASGDVFGPRPLRLVPQVGKLFPGSPLELLTDVPVASFDTSRMALVHDSLGTFPFTFTVDSLNPRKALVQANWRAPAGYRLELVRGAVTDMWGRTHDSLSVKINMPGYDAFGEMIIVPEGLDSTRQYVVLIKSGENVLDRWIVEGVKTATWRRSGLPPAKLTLEIIEDANRNGRWDTGDYPTRRPPERRQVFTPDNLRAGWDVEVKLLWK